MATNKHSPSLRERALGYLARREHSKLELRHKLAMYAEEDELTALLEDFQRRGWLSDQRFADQVVHARKSRYGSLKVAHELREKGVAEDLVMQATAALDDFESAKAVWQKKFGQMPAGREEWAKQARFLQSRGFGFEVIKRILRNEPEDL